MFTIIRNREIYHNNDINNHFLYNYFGLFFVFVEIFFSFSVFINASFLTQVLSTQACLRVLLPPKHVMSRQNLQEPQLADRHPTQAPHL